LKTTPILRIENLSKSFPGVQALDDVTFQINKGDIHALVGENGAGKSTLIKIISGAYVKDSGNIFFNGEEITKVSPIDCIRLGISTVHQELRLVEQLTVSENILLGAPVEVPSPIGKVVDWKKTRAAAAKLIDSMDIDIDADAHVSDLSVAKKQIVEICKALSRKAKLVIMDEPSATLTDKELKLLFKIIQRLKNDGITVIYISHRLEEIFEIADRVTVMRDGQHIITDDVAKMDRKKLISYMVGREIDNIFPERKISEGKVLLELKNLSVKGVLDDINLTLHEGEIIGIAGLVGSGRTELARAIFGVDKITGGEIYVRGEKKSFWTIQDAIKNKMALMPEDRKLQGIIPELPVGMNISLVGIDKITKNTFLNTKIEKQITEEYVKILRIQTPQWNQLIKYLSGGNQQKCLLAKWLFVDSDILLFDEPTRGIDVGAKQEIYKLLTELAKQGKGIIMISSELPEVIGISHRILVMHDGRITGEVDPLKTNQEEIMHLATI
jgi:ABC-type sugar transport system ATPase subunit